MASKELFPKRRTNVVLRVFQSGGRVLFDLGQRKTFKLNEIGLKVWSLLDGSHSSNSIAGEIAKEYEVDPQTSMSDCERFISEFRSLGLLDA